MRHLTILLTAAVSILGCALLNLTVDTAAAGTRMAHINTRPSRVHHARRARAGCRQRAGGSCQSGVRGTRRSASVERQTAARLHAAKSTGTETRLELLAAVAAKARAASIAEVLATPCENTELMPEPQNIGLIRAAILCLINKERAQNGETPLRLSGQLEQAAEGHSRELIAEDYFAHVSPSGETPVDRIRETGYIPNPSVGYVIGENLAWGTYTLATPAAIVSAWIASPGHLANILESQYSETGIGVMPAVPGSLGNGAPGATYAQEFGVIVP